MTRSIHQFYTRKETGEIVPNAEVTVNFAGSTEAPIYDAETGGSLISQPLIATASAKAVFYIEPGVYDIESKDPILLTTATFAKTEIGVSRGSLTESTSVDFYFATTEDLINHTFDSALISGQIAESQGFTAKGVGGAQWQHNGVTGETPSQTPADLEIASLNDADGNQWDLISDVFTSSAVGAGLGLGDDYEALLALIASDRNILIQNSTFSVRKRLLFTGLNNCIIDCEKGALINITHTSSNILEFWQGTNCRLTGIAMDGGTTPGVDGGHGIVLFECADFDVLECKVLNVGNTAMLGYSSDSAAEFTNVRFIRNETDGGQNGQSLSRMNNSFIIDGIVSNVSGSPAIGLQLKNSCNNCGIHGGTVNDVDVAIGFGQEDPVGVRNSTVSGVVAKDCQSLLSIGNANNNNISGIVGVNMSGTGVLVGGTSNNNVIEAQLDDCNNAVSNFRDTANNNVLTVKSKGPTGLYVMQYHVGTADNITYITSIEDISETSNNGLAYDLNLPTDTGNRTYYEKNGVENTASVSDLLITHNERYLVDVSRINITFDATPPSAGYFISDVTINEFKINFVGSNYAGNVFWSFS